MKHLQRKRFGIAVLASLLVVWGLSVVWGCGYKGDSFALGIVQGRITIWSYPRNSGIGNPTGWKLGADRFEPIRWLPECWVERGWYVFAMPVWIPAAIALVVTVCVRQKRVLQEECPSCGYDRSGLREAAVCPECGKAKPKLAGQ